MRAARDEPAVKQVEVVRVERTAEREHHVVRDVDDVRDRTDAGMPQTRLQPRRRLADLDVAEEAADEAEAACGILDPDPDRLVAVPRRIGPGHRPQLAVQQRRDLTRDTVDREEIGAIPGRLEVEHLVGERQHIRQRRARLERIVEHDDPGVVGAEVELVLGEDHPLRDLPTELAPLEHEAVRQRRARQRHCDLRPRAEVPRAADDRVRAILPHVDRGELQPIRIRVLRGLEHMTDAKQREIAEHADAVDAVHLGGRDRQRVGDLPSVRVDADVVPQPAERNPHRNCLRKRRSFSQNGRMPAMP